MAWPLGAGGCSLAVDLLQLVFSSCHTKAHQKLLLEVILSSYMPIFWNPHGAGPAPPRGPQRLSRWDGTQKL